MPVVVSCDSEKVTAYVDDALGAGEQAELEAHLSSCPDCRSQLEFETALRHRLRGLPGPEPDARLEARIRSGLRRRPKILRWALATAAALVLSLVWSRATPPPIARHIAEDHAHCRSVGSVALPDVPSMPREVDGLSLVAASRCELRDGSLVLHLQYLAGERRVSLFVVDRAVRFGSSYSGRLGDSDVRVLRVRDSVIGLVGDSEQELEAFARAVSA